MQQRKVKVTSHKAPLKMPKHPLNSSGSAGRVRPEQLRSLDFPKEGFNNATLRKKREKKKRKKKKMTAGALYSATLEQGGARSALLPTPLCASALGGKLGALGFGVVFFFSSPPLKK